MEYLVDLARFPRCTNQIGATVFNGSCGRSDLHAIGCRDFLFRHEPKMKDPAYDGKIFRCKHIRWARENCLDLVLEYLHRNDPNIPEEHQT